MTATTMAFEAVLGREPGKPRIRKQLMLSVSLVLHGAALVAGIIHSFWYVEELTPPTLAVTLHLGSPPPPPPPPAARAKPKPSNVDKPRPKATNQLVQPTEQAMKAPPAKEEPAPSRDDDDDKGVAGGVVGGVVGGVAGGVVPTVKAPVNEAPKQVTPQIGRQQLLINPESEEYKVKVPPALRGQDMRFAAILRICVSAQGTVTGVTVLKPADPAIDPQFPSVMGRWRYKPYTIDGRPVPFCYPIKYEISTR